LAYLGFAPLDHIASSYSARNFTPYQRLLTEFRVVLFYVSLLLFPLPARLNLDHHFTISTGFFSPVSTLISALLLLLLLTTAVTAARKHRLISFCILWFIGNLVIESSVIGLEIIFEHRMYLPSMLFGLPAVILLYSQPWRQWAKGVLFLVIITLFGFWTFERNRVWNSRIALWGDSAAKSPAKARPHNNLGVALKDEGKLVEAAVHFKKTLALDPEFTEAYNNLGNVYIQLGKFGEATKSYRKSLQISPNNAKVHMNLGNVLVKQWELEKALLHYGEALRLAPNDREAQLNFLSTRRMIESRALKKRRR
jgi:tetratricopeptide (TPR) repeat protein